MKQGQGLPVNMIILITLGIIVAIVVIAIFINVSQGGRQTITDCRNLAGGSCEVAQQGECPANYVRNFIAKCDGGKPCCVPAD